jgi:hypothetical protein
VHSKLPPNRRPAKGPLLDAVRQFRRIDPANDVRAERTVTLCSSEVWQVTAFLSLSPDELRRRKVATALRKARALCALCGLPVLEHRYDRHFGDVYAHPRGCAIGEPYMIEGS